MGGQRREPARRTLSALCGGAAMVALALAGCTVGTGPDNPTPEATPSPTVTPSHRPTEAVAPSTPDHATPAPSRPAPSPSPGEPCDPADGNPDCTDATNDNSYRIVIGWAHCVETFGEDDAYGFCFDLDSDGHWGYPDDQFPEPPQESQ